MSRLLATIVILAIIALGVWFDDAMIFLLSGFVPGINITLAPSTMLAAIVASALLVASLRFRQVVYHHCLTAYDALFTLKEDDSITRPKHRYQEL